MQQILFGFFHNASGVHDAFYKSFFYLNFCSHNRFSEPTK